MANEVSCRPYSAARLGSGMLNCWFMMCVTWCLVFSSRARTIGVTASSQSRFSIIFWSWTCAQRCLQMRRAAC